MGLKYEVYPDDVRNYLTINKGLLILSGKSGILFFCNFRQN